MLGDAGGGRREDPVSGAPGKGHRDVGGDSGHERLRAGHDLADGIPSCDERWQVAPSLLGAYPARPADHWAVEQRTARHAL